MSLDSPIQHQLAGLRMDNRKMKIVPKRRNGPERFTHAQEAPFKKLGKGHCEGRTIRLVNVEIKCAHRICRPHPGHYARTAKFRQCRSEEHTSELQSLR